MARRYQCILTGELICVLIKCLRTDQSVRCLAFLASFTVASSTDDQTKRPCEERFAARREEILAPGRAAVRPARLLRHRHPTAGRDDRRRQGDGLSLLSQQARAVSGRGRSRDARAARSGRCEHRRHRRAVRADGNGDPRLFGFFAENPEFVELLIQERAQFKDRKKPTFIDHREANVGRWQELYRSLIADGRLRDMPVERISDVISHQLYGTIFFNYVAGQASSVDEQTEAIIDVMFNGILTPEERTRPAGAAARPHERTRRASGLSRRLRALTTAAKRCEQGEIA